MLTSENREQVQNIILWALFKRNGYRRKLANEAAQLVGSVDDLIQEIYIRMIKYEVKSDIALSTFVVNHCDWCISNIHRKQKWKGRDKTKHQLEGDIPEEKYESNLEDDIFRLLWTSPLSDRELRIIRMRFFSDLTLEDIGTLLNLSRERVRQLEQRALTKLKGILGGFYEDWCAIDRPRTCQAEEKIRRESRRSTSRRATVGSGERLA